MAGLCWWWWPPIAPPRHPRSPWRWRPKHCTGARAAAAAASFHSTDPGSSSLGAARTLVPEPEPSATSHQSSAVPRTRRTPHHTTSIPQPHWSENIFLDRWKIFGILSSSGGDKYFITTNKKIFDGRGRRVAGAVCDGPSLRGKWLCFDKVFIIVYKWMRTMQPMKQ